MWYLALVVGECIFLTCMWKWTAEMDMSTWYDEEPEDPETPSPVERDDRGTEL